MRFVTDTHCLVWYLTNNRQLSGESKKLFDQPEYTQIIVPTIVMAEALYISRKTEGLPYEEAFDFIEGEERFEICPLSSTIIRQSIPLTRFEMHDALIVATALHLGLPLMTADQKIIRSGLVPTLNP